MPVSWTCKARRRSSTRPCSEELGILENGVLRIRVGLAVEVLRTGGVRVTCPADYKHHRTFIPRQDRAA